MVLRSSLIGERETRSPVLPKPATRRAVLLRGFQLFVELVVDGGNVAL